jgi:dihydrolipoamide dehydrogenase
VGRNERLLPKEDPDVSATVQSSMAGRMRLLLGHEAVSASMVEGAKRLVVRDLRTRKETTMVAEQLLIAAGRRSNTDLLHLEKTGVKVDAKGWIITNEYLETTKQGIWALGDCVNRGQFRHTANYHSQVVWNNAFGTERMKLDETAIPSAVFTWPQVGSVGMTERQAVNAGLHVHVGKKRYADIAKGYALADEDGFVKVIFDAETRRILGATIVGPQASVLIQQVVDLMNSGDGTFLPLARAQTIHPTLSEVVVGAFAAPVHAGGDEHLDLGHTHVHVHDEKGTKPHQHQHEHRHE